MFQQTQDPSQAIASQNPLLEQLRDIHTVAEPAFWPPAPGWWILGLFALVGLGYLMRMAWRRHQVARRKRLLIGVLDEIRRRWDPASEPHDYLAGMNRFFRAVALRAFPGPDAVRLEGSAWVEFIQSLLGADRNPAVEALAVGPYQPVPEFDAGALENAARAWVKHHG